MENFKKMWISVIKSIEKWSKFEELQKMLFVFYKNWIEALTNIVSMRYNNYTYFEIWKVIY